MGNSANTTFGGATAAVQDACALVPSYAEDIRSGDGGAASHRSPILAHELPLTVKEAAAYLGVSQQTVYSWVERKQIPHLRVMGRNIRFLKSELEPFRAQFKQEVVEWQDR